ncbi:MAG: ATP-binding protein [Bacteroidales bacterium]
MKDIIQSIILENQYFDYPEMVQRKIKIPVNQGVIISITGVRRSGKTFLLYDAIQRLLQMGTPKENIIFINFEDERINLDVSTLHLIIESYYELYPDIQLKNTSFFFDEVQNIPGWEKFVRRVYDTKTRNIYITGSNSRYLSKEIATELRGRTLPFTLFPLSFSEFLDFSGIDKRLYPQSQKSRIINYMQQFLTDGGFPEVQIIDKQYRTRLLQQYFNVMIFRDIVERYQVSNVEELKFFIKKIFAGVTKPFSVNKAYNDLRSLGYKVSNKYLYDYLTYCNDVFLCQNVNRFDYSEIKQNKSDKKQYVIDTGLLHAIEFSVSQNKGKLLENMVFLEFLKQEKQVFYHKEVNECDFVIRSGSEYKPVQVCWTLNDETTQKREFTGLKSACDYLHTDQGLIITFDEKREARFRGKSFEIIPVYEYFLQNG